MPRPVETPYTDTLRDRAIALMQDDGVTVTAIGEAMGVTKQAASKFLNGGGVDYELGKRLESWEDERDGQEAE
jgi:predicted transcriptional regulator